MLFGQPLAWVAQNITAWELEMWRVWLARYPTGPRQDDYRAAVVASSLAGSKAFECFASLSVAADRGGKVLRAWSVAHCPAMQHKG